MELVCFATFSSQQSTGNLQHSTCCQLWMLPPTRNVRTTATTTGTTGTSGCNNSAAQLTVIAGASCFRTTNGLINYVFDISPPPPLHFLSAHSSTPCPSLTLSLSVSASVCHSGIDDVAGAALEARVQIKFTIMTTQMDSVMGHAASGKWNWEREEGER